MRRSAGLAQLSAAALALTVGPSLAQERSSAYSDLDIPKTCTVTDAAAEGEGEWSNFICAGYRGFPIFLSSADGRDSVFFGFPPATGATWESFSAFNRVGTKVEWRLHGQGERALPLAAILRYTVQDDPADPAAKVEVLVVEKVGRPGENAGCAVGLVMATGNPNANEEAQSIADNQAFDFACGSDQPTFVSDERPLPEWNGNGEAGEAAGGG